MTRALVEHPPGRLAERGYIYEILLRERLGIDYEMVARDRRDVRITLVGNGKELIVSDVLFGVPAAEWLNESSLPPGPLRWWTLPTSLSGIPGVQPSVPVLYSGDRTGDLYSERQDGARLDLDVFGGAFFMLTRYEELVRADRDIHGRFPASAALAGREGFLERPIADEYCEILWRIMARLWPGLQRRPQSYKLVISHDIDSLLTTLVRSPAAVLRNCAGDLLRRRDPLMVLRRLRSYLEAKRGRFDLDPNNTFDYLMDQSELHGVTSAFYFFAGARTNPLDPAYDVRHPWIRGMLKHINRRGHEIGIHLGYGTYRDIDLTREGVAVLRQVLSEEGVEQDRWGGRQHYLRWENPTTWRNWDDAGLDYDGTLGYADRIGFRCGTCHEFSVFDLKREQQLRLREVPLIVMEGTLLEYMELPRQEALEKAAAMARRCKDFAGCFSLLWHNHSVVGKHDKRYYESALEAVERA